MCAERMGAIVNRMVSAMTAGVAGATALTVVHQVARAITQNAPRMDILGTRAVHDVYRRCGGKAPSDQDAKMQALAGDIVANTAYYSLVGIGDRKRVWSRGLGLGVLAGVGALVLPMRIGLGEPPHAHRRDTQLMTIAWYVVGGLVAAAAFRSQGSSPGQG
jgi:hypothetical protein